MQGSLSVRAGAEARRPVLRRRPLVGVVGASAAATALFFLLRPMLPAAWSTPGSPELYLTGVAGSLLALAPFAFAVAKRSGRASSPPAWFVAHAVLGCAGVALLAVHSGLHLGRPPALLLVGGVFLVAQGAWARLALPRTVAATFGTKHRPFVAPAPLDRRRLAAIIGAKRALLAQLAPGASEATFSPLPGHWLRRPLATLRYARLAHEETRLIGQRRAVGPVQAYWRAVHVAVAWLFLAGLVVHVVTVTFFAGYVAGGGEIGWWHVTAWGAPAP